MKLLIVGSKSQWSIEGEYEKYLKDMCDVHFFNAHGLFLIHYHKSIKNKIIYRLGLSNILKSLNRQLIDLCKQTSFDAIIVFKGMEIFPETLSILRERGIKLFNYNPDHPFVFFGKGSGNKNVLQGIPFYHHHFTYSRKISSELIEKFKTSSSWLPFGYSQAKVPGFMDKEIIRACFIGNADKYRARMIKKLIDNNISVDVYGNNWNRFLSPNANLKFSKAIFANNFVNMAQKYRVQLNFFRPHNYDSHNMRTFEMPALGCIMLTPISNEQKSFFEDLNEVFYFSKNNLIDKCKGILSLGNEEAYRIKLNAYNRSINSNYCYKNRAIEMFRIIDSYCK